jgi:Protein of unknown function (DUF2806)
MDDNNNSEKQPQDEQASSPLIDVEIGNTHVDLRGIGELKGVFNNLIKSVARGLGRVYDPVDRVRAAKADRQVVNERAQTIIDLTQKAAELASLQKTFSISDSPADRAMSYLLGEAIPKRENKDRILEAVATEIKVDPPTEDTSETIADDWLTQFWSRAEHIGDEHVQRFLARLLAKEIYQPGSISPLTLSVITTLSPQVAKTFEHFCRLSIRFNTEVFVIHPAVYVFQNIGPLDQFGVSFDDLYELEAYGLIRSAETIMYNYTVAPDAPPEAIDYAGQPAQLNFSGLQIHQIRFSRAGREIRQLLLLSPLPEYTDALRSRFTEAFLFN